MQMRFGVRKIDENSWDFVSMRIHQKGGHEQMCDLVENYARRLFQNGGSYELVRDSIPSLSAERLQEIYDEVRNKYC